MLISTIKYYNYIYFIYILYSVFISEPDGFSVFCQPVNVTAIMKRMSIQTLADYTFDLGPIRPPSEAFSLLIRATMNCPWNRCKFCTNYKKAKFALRPVEDVLKDIDNVHAVREEIIRMARDMGHPDKVRDVAGGICNQPGYNGGVHNVALWMWAGEKSAFLQDANSLIMKTPDLVKVVTYLKQTFPQLERITSYARSKTARQKPLEDLVQIRKAGLDRLHIGMESGSDRVLEFIEKGTTARDHIEGGLKIKEAGMELSEYIIPGLGGRAMSKEHIEGTAETLNSIDPHFIRLRSLFVNRKMPLWQDMESGVFELLSDDEVVAEIGSLISNLEVTSMLKSDHIMNLLPEIEGKFPQAKEQCLAVIERYLSLPERIGSTIVWAGEQATTKHLQTCTILPGTSAWKRSLP